MMGELDSNATGNLRNYIVQKRWNTFNLGLSAAKNTDQIKKRSNKSCLELNFLRKSPQVHMSISLPPPH